MGLFDQPRIDFNKDAFDQIVEQKGRRVLYEKVLECPCKSRGSDAQGLCRNCIGLGWIFLPSQEARMVIQGMSIATSYKPWSEEERGMINITAEDRYKLSFMDRVTILDSTSVFNETLHFKVKQDKYFAYSIYRIKEVEIAALFIGVDQEVKQLFLEKGDFWFEENRVFLKPKMALLAGGQDVSISLRYQHAPAYHIVENKRDTMDTFVVENGSEKYKKLPISAFARRAHYIPDVQNLNGTRIIKNSFTLKEEDYSTNTDSSNIFQSQFNPPFS